MMGALGANGNGNGEVPSQLNSLVKFCVLENKSSRGLVLVCSHCISNELGIIILCKGETGTESCREKERLPLNQITKIA